MSVENKGGVRTTRACDCDARGSVNKGEGYELSETRILIQTELPRIR